MTKNEQIKNNMDEKEFDLLMKDLCGRLPYGVKANVSGWDEEKQEEVNIPLRVYSIDTDGYLHFESNDYGVDYYGIEHCTLFLRPMSSMTEEECDMVEVILGGENIFDFMRNGDIILKEGNFTQVMLSRLYDYFNSIHVDYRGLIPKGLAIEAKEGMYNN